MSKLKKLGTSFVMVLAVIVALACTLVFTACGNTPADEDNGEQGTINNGGDNNQGGQNQGGENDGDDERTAVVMPGDVWVFDSVEYTWTPDLDEADEVNETVVMRKNMSDALYKTMKITIGENNQCRMTMKFPVMGDDNLPEFDDEGNIKYSDTESGEDYTYTIGEDGKVTLVTEYTDAQDLVINGDTMTFKIISPMDEEGTLTLTANITLKLSK